MERLDKHMERLDKLLCSTGLWTRREAKTLIRTGRVQVDHHTVRDPAVKIDPERETVSADGQRITCQRYTWVMLNKPAGYLSATEDGRGPVVLDLLPPELRRRGLFPVGRLDRDTLGLLLLTNDGVTAHRLLSPKWHVDKVYRARVAGCLTAEDCAAFRAGLVLSDGLQCLPAELEIVSAGPGESEALVTVREGKFHQVKRMFAARGKPVLTLERVRMGNLPLDSSLSRGSFRFLSPIEIQNLSDFPDNPRNRVNKI